MVQQGLPDRQRRVLKLLIEFEPGLNHARDVNLGIIPPFAFSAEVPQGFLQVEEGIQISEILLAIDRDITTNVIPRATPLPGPMPEKFDLGWEFNVMYGVDESFFGLPGIDADWSINEGEKAHLGIPQFFLQGYVPFLGGTSFLIGNFGKDASREEMQEIAFRDAEKEAYPFVDRWINLAAIKAMGLEGTSGKIFVPTLEKLLEDAWAGSDLKNASREALRRIRGQA